MFVFVWFIISKWKMALRDTQGRCKPSTNCFRNKNTSTPLVKKNLAAPDIRLGDRGSLKLREKVIRLWVVAAYDQLSNSHNKIYSFVMTL